MLTAMIHEGSLEWDPISNAFDQSTDNFDIPDVDWASLELERSIEGPNQYDASPHSIPAQPNSPKISPNSERSSRGMAEHNSGIKPKKVRKGRAKVGGEENDQSAVNVMKHLFRIKLFNFQFIP
jgi:hypothetical protein